MASILSLLFHDVIEAGRPESSGFQSPDANIYKFTAEEFAGYLDVVAAGSHWPVTTAEAVLGGTAKGLVWTFDDGGAGALEPTARMLEARGWRGVFFVTTNYIGQPGFLDAAGIRELRQRGHAIGSHSASHPLLMGACSEAQLCGEWTESVGVLSDILGERVTIASVPGGYYRRRVGEAAAKAGIRLLFNSEPVTSVGRVDGCLVAGRFSIQQGVTREWTRALVTGSPGPRWSSWAYWNAKKALKAAGGEAWLALRRRLIASRRG
jgi:peptidoglycan/xylan/chitin deacetylase (PgdA/CDA1 family)